MGGSTVTNTGPPVPPWVEPALTQYPLMRYPDGAVIVIEVCSPLTSILPESCGGQTSPGAAFTRSAGRTSAIIISTHPRSTAIPALLTFTTVMDSRPSLVSGASNTPPVDAVAMTATEWPPTPRASCAFLPRME
jgi:hypothetical protein